MAIIGIERLIYGVEDVAESTRFFTDFGLEPVDADGEGAHLGLANGARIVILPLGHPDLPSDTKVEGQGVQQVVWGVDCDASLVRLTDRLAGAVAVTRDDDLVRFTTPFGVPMALRVWKPRPLACLVDPANAPGRIERLNRPRRWRFQAVPRMINHTVFAVPDYDNAHGFMIDVLGFRLTDRQNGFGNYLRADGTHNHHNILLLNADAPFPGVDGKLRFHHANFALEDIDEMMIAVNNMRRKGWQPSDQGLGRHRIDSALFYYLPCPAGGEAEYGADADYVDDNWVPREWINPLFAYAHWVHDLPPFLMQEPEWDFRYLTGIEPAGDRH